MYNQLVIDPEFSVYLSLGDVDLIDVFNPNEPVKPLPPLIQTVRIEVLYMDDEEMGRKAYYYGKSFDDGARFAVRRGHSGGYGTDLIPDLEDLAKAFYKLKL